MEKRKQHRFGIAVAVALFLMWILAGCSSRVDSSPGVVRGFIDLSGHDLYQKTNIRLDGDWQFFKNILPVPKDFSQATPPEADGFYPVPEYWTHYKDLNLIAEGSATYRLRVRVKEKGRPLSLLTPEIFTEYRLFVNGVCLDSHGHFADAPPRFLAPRVYTFQNDRQEVEILLNISNRRHGNAGIGQSFFLGSPDHIQRQHFFSTMTEMVLIAVCLFAGIYHIILFFFRRTETELLYFGLLCLYLALRTLTTGTTLITQIIPGLSFEIGSRLATATIPLCVIAFQAYGFRFLKSDFPVLPHRLLLGLHGIYMALVMTLPTLTYSRLFSYYLLIIICSGLMIIGAGLNAAIKKREYALIFLGGFVFLFAGVVNDMLHYMQIINTGYYLCIWFSFFIIAQSVMLAIRFANEHRMIKALSRQLQASDRIKDEFLANTSHELRTPLNGIIGISDSLLDGVAGSLPGQAVNNLQLIASSARRLASLINDILDLSRLRNNDISLSVKAIDLRQIVEVVLAVVRATIPAKKLDLINEVGKNFPQVMGDEDRLQQILFNLIGNAVKFTDQGQVRVWAQDRGNHILVHVQDTGPGIPQDKQEAIFFPFEQVDGTATRKKGGTGLGLSITKKLVELQGGTIQVQSDEKTGALFSFSLKKSDASDDFRSVFPESYTKKIEVPPLLDPVFEPDLEPREPSRDKGAKILIVDDEPTNIQVLKNFLVLENFCCDAATDGLKALEMIKTGEFNLILLDIMMPRMSGYEVLSRIRKQYQPHELPVLMLTAGNQPRDIVTAFQSGANDYLSKPIGRQELMVRIRTQLSLSCAVSDAITNARLANTDALTGLYNRRFLIHSGKREFTRTAKESCLSLIMLDIDRFKIINDTWGHPEGDRVLCHLASLITENIRGVDVAARYGGEEFVILLPDTREAGGIQTAEKLRHLAEQASLSTSCGDEIRYTISAGVAGSEGNPGADFNALLAQADKMLYQAKNSGRNRVRPEK